MVEVDQVQNLAQEKADLIDSLTGTVTPKKYNFDMENDPYRDVTDSLVPKKLNLDKQN